MSRLISELLGATEPMFGLAINQLERSSGKPGVDVKLTAEIINSAKQKTRDLNLDPDDTTGNELYQALLAKIKQDDIILMQLLGCQDGDSAQQLMGNIKKYVDSAGLITKCWVIKKSVAKQFLKTMPPPNIMKQLKYKSVSSMLKTENIFELYGALRFAETANWLKKFNQQYSTLIPSDFELRDIELHMMPSKRWAELAKPFIDKKQHNITHLKELGSVNILPLLPGRVNARAITILPLVIHYINEIRLYASFFKMQQVKPHFAQIVADTLNADTKHVANISGQNIHWRVVQRYYGKLGREQHPEIFEPHVQPEDLLWRKAEATLFELDASLGWWQNLDYVGVLHKRIPVTFNLMDVAVSFANNAPYEKRRYYHFRESLWNELFARYMGEKILEQQILMQLGGGEIEPQTITSNLHKKRN